LGTFCFIFWYMQLYRETTYSQNTHFLRKQLSQRFVREKPLARNRPYAPPRLGLKTEFRGGGVAHRKSKNGSRFGSRFYSSGVSPTVQRGGGRCGGVGGGRGRKIEPPPHDCGSVGGAAWRDERGEGVAGIQR
jgi:hypothetical protein